MVRGARLYRSLLDSEYQRFATDLRALAQEGWEVREAVQRYYMRLGATWLMTLLD